MVIGSNPFTPIGNDPFTPNLGSRPAEPATPAPASPTAGMIDDTAGLSAAELQRNIDAARAFAGGPGTPKPGADSWELPGMATSPVPPRTVGEPGDARTAEYERQARELGANPNIIGRTESALTDLLNRGMAALGGAIGNAGRAAPAFTAQDFINDQVGMTGRTAADEHTVVRPSTARQPGQESTLSMADDCLNHAGIVMYDKTTRRALSHLASLADQGTTSLTPEQRTDVVNDLHNLNRAADAALVRDSNGNATGVNSNHCLAREPNGAVSTLEQVQARVSAVVEANKTLMRQVQNGESFDALAAVQANTQWLARDRVNVAERFAHRRNGADIQPGGISRDGPTWENYQAGANATGRGSSLEQALGALAGGRNAGTRSAEEDIIRLLSELLARHAGRNAAAATPNPATASPVDSALKNNAIEVFTKWNTEILHMDADKARETAQKDAARYAAEGGNDRLAAMTVRWKDDLQAATKLQNKVLAVLESQGMSHEQAQGKWNELMRTHGDALTSLNSSQINELTQLVSDKAVARANAREATTPRVAAETPAPRETGASETPINDAVMAAFGSAFTTLSRVAQEAVQAIRSQGNALPVVTSINEETRPPSPNLAHVGAPPNRTNEHSV